MYEVGGRVLERIPRLRHWREYDRCNTNSLGMKANHAQYHSHFPILYLSPTADHHQTLRHNAIQSIVIMQPNQIQYNPYTITCTPLTHHRTASASPSTLMTPSKTSPNHTLLFPPSHSLTSLPPQCQGQLPRYITIPNPQSGCSLNSPYAPTFWKQDVCVHLYAGCVRTPENPIPPSFTVSLHPILPF